MNLIRAEDGLGGGGGGGYENCTNFGESCLEAEGKLTEIFLHASVVLL